jgi:hypothetical protein
MGLFRKSPSQVVRPVANAEVEKLMAESLRALGKLFTKVAELLDAQRLQRAGFRDQGSYLERVDGPAGPAKDRAQGR